MWKDLVSHPVDPANFMENKLERDSNDLEWIPFFVS